MKKLLLLGSAAVAFATAAPAFAQVTGEVDVNGFVDDRCQFTVDNAVINLGEISDNATGKLDKVAVDAGAATLNGWCNGSAATIAVEAHPLLNSAAGSASFDNRVDYKATATAGNAAPTDLTTAAGPGTPASLGLFSGDILVDISDSASPNNRLMVAGDYVGSIVVTLTPNTSFGEESPGD
jgi:type 1 fimbria pilin